MMTDHSPLPSLRADMDYTMDALVDNSRRLRRFWPLLADGPQPAAAPAPAGLVRVPSDAQRLVAGMAEYGF
ncbi:hypothetical protein [Streptomyces rubellomurinus]|uniref:Uncharacterized protein n=2 Tax=Streptomyces TaxID=1883 RepID=A0A0F2TMC0_STRR3|nr:hypothetical protein [Streptomyces rubellomurinus]KJS63641.1 hypothetical protein VM95_01930 [Streptomyces rubellomurinus]